ncbi:MAG: DUF3006 domain-containing protein [Clostridia bacterium]|nr:DUF3006 domain-containing protein [Clostridia bacterium]
MRLIVDRIEEGIAVLEKEDLSHIEISIDELPQGTCEGAVLIFDGKSYITDREEEAQRKTSVLKKQQMLFKKIKKD